MLRRKACLLPARSHLSPRTHWRNRRRVRRRASGRTVAYNLRFPGQIFDGQAGLHYNYFRDYDPALGGYPQSDPMGLGGGINTYAYGNRSPLSGADPTGRIAAVAIPAAVGVAAGVAVCYLIPNCWQGLSDAAGEVTDAIGNILSPPMHADEANERERGLPPQGVDPPVEGECKVGPASRPSERDKGGKSLWDSKGGEWRWYPGDKWHNPHWDYNPHTTPSAPWENIPHSDQPPVKP